LDAGRLLRYYRLVQRQRGRLVFMEKGTILFGQGKALDFVCVGSATQDVFVSSDASTIVTLNEMHREQQLLAFPYGGKVNVRHIEFTTGGGATNSAVSLARLGARSAFLGKLGPDQVGRLILEELEGYGVDASYHLTDAQHSTGYSVILTSHEGDRTVLTYRGASTEMTPEEIDWSLLNETAWIYVTSLSGGSASVVGPLFARAAQAGVRIAFNPGSAQLKLGLEGLSDILPDVDVLLVNKHEAEMLSGVRPLKDVICEARCRACGRYLSACPPGALRQRERLAPEPLDGYGDPPGCRPECPPDEIEIVAWPFNMSEAIAVLTDAGVGVVVVTDGANGVEASDGEVLYRMAAQEVKVASSLGAGDAFGSAFTLEFARSGDIGRALALGTANAGSVIQAIGAKNGLLAADEAEEVLRRFRGDALRRYRLADVVAVGRS
jgi:ribokinase